MIGARLKLARAAAGLSLRELEARLEGLVSAQAIGKYERDEMMPSSSVLIALSKALSVSVDYLLSPGEVELVGVEFRKKRLTSAKETAEVQSRILSAVERYLEVERILALEPTEVFKAKDRVRVRSVDDVENAADALRVTWQLGVDAIPNLCEFLEEKGIKVCALDLPDADSGVQATVKDVDQAKIPVIVVNSKHQGERQRFTVAHELGHMYLDVSDQENLEPLCQRFAGAFLIPAEVLRREVGSRRHSIGIRELFHLKQLFGVSAQAIAYRCRDLDIINKALFSQIFKVFNANGWRLREPNEIAREEPRRFERLCLRALAEDVISEAKASELLQKGIRELVDSVDQPPDVESGAAASSL
jgi:Zn-dependent peptidase ImmA (M78 family)